ncbi:MAG: nickel pincer cofactor biosynthesis protein LarC [Actinobacteria bacterium]|nr:MAG: nickel pincer cofactor biosynthesis protein LarC [Actinomycetota bacterium]
MIAYLDCSTGVSGNKFLGALINAGFTIEELRATLAPLGLADAVAVHEVRSAGIAAVGVEVAQAEDARWRHWRDIRAMLESAEGLAEPVRADAIRAFTLLAEAEARVHGVPVEQVHFHEVGAADTIVDIVGVAAGIQALGIERLVASPVAVGSGTIECSHGVLPVPAPATAALLEGIVICDGGIAGELTTPTGAALLRAFVSEYGALPPMTVRACGTGAGTRDIGVPNVTRILLGDVTAPLALEPGAEAVVVLHSNVDHLSAEHLAYAAERLLEAGALDVWQTPIVMKKGRAAVTLSALTMPDEAAALSARLIAETGTLGVRIDPTTRFIAKREVVELKTSLGSVRVKSWQLGDRRGARPEFEDVARTASAKGRPVAEVAAELTAEARRLLGITD